MNATLSQIKLRKSFS
jgi:hypothetical protein